MLSSETEVREHVRLLFDSFIRTTKRPLWDKSWFQIQDDRILAHAFNTAPCVLASHGAEADPILNYGNKSALNLWETNWDTFTTMPSRLTAEPVERIERERLLHEVTTKGFIENYSGVRISTTGKRFLIHQATVWNVIDLEDIYRGQAVVFSEWEWL